MQVRADDVLELVADVSRRFHSTPTHPHELPRHTGAEDHGTHGEPMMKCPECERTGQRSKLYMPTGYFSTAMGGTQTTYDEDGHRHHHEVNSSHGQGSCSNGHLLDVRLSDKCPAPDCDYGTPQTITFTGSRPTPPEPSYYRIDNVAFTVPREPGVSSGTEHKENRT